jgi:hypothetical protein
MSGLMNLMLGPDDREKAGVYWALALNQYTICSIAWPMLMLTGYSPIYERPNMRRSRSCGYFARYVAKQVNVAGLASHPKVPRCGQQVCPLWRLK